MGRSVYLSGALSVAQVRGYWQEQYTSVHESYYSQKGQQQGHWAGEQAAAFGLVGGVTKEAFDRLAEGQHPETGEQLVEHVQRQRTKDGKELAHRAALDCTISPHKSITAAAIVGGDVRLVAAHERAVEQVIAALEEYTQARVGGGPAANTGKLVAAVFLHKEARPVGGVPDPHLHSHVVVFNMTEHEGDVCAVQPLEWYRIQRYLDAVYQSEMAVAVQELGYRLDRQQDGSVAAIAGYTPAYLEDISRRTSEIAERQKELGLEGAKAAQRIAHSSREAKVDWPPERIEAYHVEQSWAHGIDPVAVPEAARARGRVHVPVVGVEAALTYGKEAVVERNAVFDHYELMEQSLRHGLGSVRREHLESALARRGDEFLEVRHHRDSAPGHRYTTPEMRGLERDLMEWGQAGRGALGPISPQLTREEFRERYQGNLNNAQMRLAYNIVTCPDRLFAVQGGAGVGKTFALDPTRQIIEDMGYEVYGVAPTSRAATELTEAGIRNAQTIQRYLALEPPPAGKPRVVFLDESSLASTKQAHALVSSLRPEDRVILAGDIRQHQSVEAGRIFEQLQQSGLATFYLNKILRQREAPELLEVVRAFSKGDVAEAVLLMEEQDRIREYPDVRKRYRALAADYAESPANTVAVSPDNESRKGLNEAIRARLQEDGHVARESVATDILLNRQDLTAEGKRHAFSYRAGDVVRFPRRNRDLGVAARELGEVVALDCEKNQVTCRLADGREITYAPPEVRGVQVFSRETRDFAVGDRVQFTQPWRSKGIDNRDFGEIVALDAAGNVRIRIVDKQDAHTVSFALRENPYIEYGYAVTSYSIQGGAKDNVLVHVAVEDTRTRAMVDKIFANVAVSRARLDCRIYTDCQDDLARALGCLHLKPKAHSLEEISRYRMPVGREKVQTPATAEEEPVVAAPAAAREIVVPSPREPGWIWHDGAWRQYVERLFLRAVEEGKNPLDPQSPLTFETDAGAVRRGVDLLVDAIAQTAVPLRIETADQLHEYLGMEREYEKFIERERSAVAS